MASINASTTVSETRSAGNLAQRLNWLRASVLGANDGIVSVAAIVIGVASAGGAHGAILAAGAAALIGGAISMALGEYVSVSSQSDSQRALIKTQEKRLKANPLREFNALKEVYLNMGLSAQTATAVATELTEKNAVDAHLSARYNIDEDEIVSPWHAAIGSASAFTVGALLPFLAIILLPETIRIPATFAAVLVALASTGALGAWIGGAKAGKAAIRVVIGGVLALGATFLIGTLLGASGIV